MNDWPDRWSTRIPDTVAAWAVLVRRRMATRLARMGRIVSRDRIMAGEPSWPIDSNLEPKSSRGLAICKQLSAVANGNRRGGRPAVRPRQTEIQRPEHKAFRRTWPARPRP